MNVRRHVPVASARLASDASEMNPNPATATADTSSKTSQTVKQPLDIKALAVALAGIRSDSQRESETYLRDTVVPHGGE